jgi:dCMP deaminase
MSDSMPFIDLTRGEQKQQTFLEIARTLGELGTCDRKKVGAVIVRDGRCISWGYNGAPPGMDHCEENFHGWDNSMDIAAMPVGPKREAEINRTKRCLEEHGCRNVTHAEANAVAFAARQGISTDGATLYVTVSPCEVCARLLIAAGIVHVAFEEEYRNVDGIRLLMAAGVKCIG